jgi:hypothetical protein
MLADAEYFNARISKLDGAGDLGAHIMNVVRAKTIINEPGNGEKTSMERQNEGEQETADLISEREKSAEGSKA